MALELSLDYRLRYLDFDQHEHIQPVTLLDLFQDAATLHANDIGIGRDDMMDQGVFWAIVRMRYEVLKQPKRAQTVTVRTWPHTPSSFSFLRDYALTDEAGEVLIKGASEWVLMDIETRKFAKMKDHYHGPTNFLEERAFDAKPRKIAPFEECNRPIYTATPTFSDIDVNGHVNNARYPRFVIDAWQPGPKDAIRTFQIDYRHEVMPDAPLAVHLLVEDNHVLSKGVRQDGNTAFVCAIDLDA